MREEHGVPEHRCFNSWEDLLEEDRFADCVLICTLERDHMGAVPLAHKGYHILLEKPMAVTLEDCRAIYKASKDADIIMSVCTVLRYLPIVGKMRDLILSGVIGEVVNVNLVSPIAFWNFAHAFVRGNMANTERSAFLALSYGCHDLDLVSFLVDTRCIRVSSFGSLVHFRKDKKPEGAGSRCLECDIERSCPYSARRIYLDPKPTGPKYPVGAVCREREPKETYLERVEQALREGPYGKCVYDLDNDVCDNQVIYLEFENGATASLTLVGPTEELLRRQLRIHGSKGQLMWDGNPQNPVRHFDFLTQKVNEHTSSIEVDSSVWDHGGADYFTIKAFVDAVAENNKDYIYSGPEEALASHLLSFAAEDSRKTGCVVTIPNSRYAV
ncbi:putative oxidoreductase YteT isoform X2 [Oratosquilla oratoria]